MFFCKGAILELLRPPRFLKSATQNTNIVNHRSMRLMVPFFSFVQLKSFAFKKSTCSQCYIVNVKFISIHFFFHFSDGVHLSETNFKQLLADRNYDPLERPQISNGKSNFVPLLKKAVIYELIKKIELCFNISSYIICLYLFS